MSCFTRIFFFLIFLGVLSKSSNVYSQDTIALNHAINKAVKYLDDRVKQKQLYFYIVPLLKPVALYYNLPILKTKNENCHYSLYEKYLIDLFSPLYTQRKLTKTDKSTIDSLSAIDRLIMYSLYGNKLYNEKYFSAYMDSLIAWGRYDLSHAYLITLLLKNKPFIPEKTVEYFFEKTQPLIIKMLPRKESHYSDLDIEIIALLLYANYNLDSEYISILITQQTSEGTWIDKPGENNELMDDHTTCLALWALLEWKYKSDTFLYLAHPTFIQQNRKLNY